MMMMMISPWSWVLIENLIVAHLLKKFSALYGTRKFITMLTTAGHCSLF
jgi:hypothetical protein